jgi:hypothetical protein
MSQAGRRTLLLDIRALPTNSTLGLSGGRSSRSRPRSSPHEAQRQDSASRTAPQIPRAGVTTGGSSTQSTLSGHSRSRRWTSQSGEGDIPRIASRRGEDRLQLPTQAPHSLLRQARLAQALIKAVVIAAQIRSVVWLARLELGDRPRDVERQREIAMQRLARLRIVA